MDNVVNYIMRDMQKQAETINWYSNNKNNTEANLTQPYGNIVESLTYSIIAEKNVEHLVVRC